MNLINYLLQMLVNLKQVQKQTCLCIRDVLQSFRATLLLSPASQIIFNLLKNSRYDLHNDIKNLSLGQLEELSLKPDSFRKGLYVLDVVEESLCLMPIEYRNQVLNEFTTLLKVHNSLVAIHVTNCLYRICLTALDVPAQLLLHLLCFFSADPQVVLLVQLHMAPPLIGAPNSFELSYI